MTRSESKKKSFENISDRDDIIVRAKLEEI